MGAVVDGEFEAVAVRETRAVFVETMVVSLRPVTDFSWP